MKAEKSSSPLDGVSCNVNSCHYWGNGDRCHAKSIQVEPPGSSTSQDTDCSTFAPKSGL